MLHPIACRNPVPTGFGALHSPSDPKRWKTSLCPQRRNRRQQVNQEYCSELKISVGRNFVDDAEALNLLRGPRNNAGAAILRLGSLRASSGTPPKKDAQGILLVIIEPATLRHYVNLKPWLGGQIETAYIPHRRETGACVWADGLNKTWDPTKVLAKPSPALTPGPPIPKNQVSI